MWLLLLCSVIAVSVFLDRMFFFHRATIRVGDLLQGVRALLQSDRHSEAVEMCARSPGPAARVMHAALLRPHSPRSELKDIVQEAGQLEVPRLESKISILSTLAYLAPLIGLLGTVSGLIDVFGVVSANNGIATAADISKGIYQALLTSAAGLVVAIPCTLLYGYLSAWVSSLLHDMERAGIEIVNLLTERRAQPEILEFEPPRQNLAQK